MDKILRVILGAALLCVSVHGDTTISSKRNIVPEVVPGIGSYYHHPIAMSWTDAATFCREERGETLAFPNSVEEANLLAVTMKANSVTYIHVGFHDKYKEGEYYKLTGQRVKNSCYKQWYNQGGSPTLRNCGAFRDYYGLMDIPCSTNYTFICVNYNFFTEDFDYIPGHGYYKMHRARRSWLDAQKTCESESANLLVLNSESELAALSTRYGQFTAWVGVHHLHVDGQFVTIFDESLSSTGFSRWQSGQPSGTNEQNPYVIINSTPGFGLASRRSNDFHSFICELYQRPNV